MADPTVPPLSGVVLAGGASTRMGRDKATVRIDGMRLVDRAVSALQECCAEVLVASGGRRRLAHLSVPQIADAQPGAGPLAGLVAGLETARHPLVAVVAVDHPWPSATLLQHLAAQWEGEAAVVPSVGGRLQPLHAVWARRSAVALRLLLAGGVLGVTGAAVRLGARIVEEDDWTAATGGDAAWALNVNRPGDLPG